MGFAENILERGRGNIIGVLHDKGNVWHGICSILCSSSDDSVNH